VTQEDATNLLIEWMRDPEYLRDHSIYGYDVYLPSLVRAYIKNQGVQQTELENQFREIIDIFYPSAWELCRRGILRPGINSYLAQETADGSAGNGYSVTPFGRTWLKESDQDNYVPTEPERFGQLLEPFRERFGPGFYERAQQAVRCYGAHAYLACCAMCGAASESIILATAMVKSGNEKEILKIYRSASGRTKTENLIIGQLRSNLKRECQGYSSLVKYWRDESSHGTISSIKDNEAFTSLALLLRFAKFVDDNWVELTSN